MAWRRWWQLRWSRQRRIRRRYLFASLSVAEKGLLCLFDVVIVVIFRWQVIVVVLGRHGTCLQARADAAWARRRAFPANGWERRGEKSKFATLPQTQARRPRSALNMMTETCNKCHHANSVTYPDLRRLLDRLLGYCSLYMPCVHEHVSHDRRPIDNRIESISHLSSFHVWL